MSSLKPWLRWFLDVGPARAGWRLGHELVTRSGAIEWISSREVPVELSPPPEFSTDVWLDALPEGHWFRATREKITTGAARTALESLLSPREREVLLERAQRASRGMILAHGGLELDFLSPRQWRLAPLDPARRSWPLVHGQRIWGHARTLGDIKDVWAIGRVLYVFDWVRARSFFGEFCEGSKDTEQATRWARLLASDFESFEAQNPYLAGPHWASGQECAIRALNWCFAVAALGQDEGFEQRDFARFVRLIELHARFIDRNLDFARFAVPNNHLIIESIALSAIGVLFPWFRDAEHYRTRGAQVLAHEALEQFLADGSYIQASHNYHRLATEYLLWAARLIPAKLLSPHRLRGIFHRTRRFLHHQMCAPSQGHLPNWGANDGARMHRLSETEHRDYRPLLVSLGAETNVRPAFGRGPWDEEAFWLSCESGADVLISDVPEVAPDLRHANQSSTIAPSTTLDLDDWCVMFRTRPPIGLASQCDLFHVDVWYGEQNIALDAGSYRYHDDAWHEWFSGAASHNAIHLLSPRGEVLGPRERPARFAYHAREDMAQVLRRCDRTALATHSGWKRHGMSHYEREVLLTNAGCVVHDRLHVAREVKVCLHWLLDDLGWCASKEGLLTRGEVVELSAVDSPVFVSLDASEGGGGILRREVCLLRGVSPQDPPSPFASPRIAGWFSPSYGVRRCAVSVMLVCDLAPGSYVLTTEFTACASR